MLRISRRALAAVIAAATLLPHAAFAAEAPKEIRIDWATYNPVSLVFTEGLVGEGIRQDLPDVLGHRRPGQGADSGRRSRF